MRSPKRQLTRGSCTCVLTIRPSPGGGGASGAATTLASGDVVLTAGEGSLLVLSFRGEERARLDLDGIQLGVVDDVSDAVSYDPFPIAVPQPLHVPPESLRFRAVTEREVDCPLVVSESAAQRRLASECSDTTTTQPSACEAARACSTNS